MQRHVHTREHDSFYGGDIRLSLYPMYSWPSLVAQMKLRTVWTLLMDYIGTVHFAPMMQLCGFHMESGSANSEVSKMIGLLPDVTCIGDNSFWGNGGLCTQLTFQDNTCSVGICRFPTGFFAGNNCVLSPGNYPTDCLVGVNTYASPHLLRRKLNSLRDEPTTWFGCPAVQMPMRKGQMGRPSDCEDPALTPDLPTFYEYIRRCLMMEWARCRHYPDNPNPHLGPDTLGPCWVL